MGMAICTCCGLKCTHFCSHSYCAQMHNVCSLMTLVPCHECSDPNSCPYTREDLQVQQAGTWPPLRSRLHHLLQFQPSPTCKQVWLTQHMCCTFNLPIHREILLTLYAIPTLFLPNAVHYISIQSERLFHKSKCIASLK